MRWVFLLSLSCAISEPRYRAMQRAQFEKNEASRAAATRALLEREHLREVTTPPVFVISAANIDQATCRRKAFDPSAMIELSGLEGRSSMGDLCAFVLGGPTLFVEHAERPLIRAASPWWATDEKGELVSFSVAPRTVWVEHVTVSMSCNFMPVPQGAYPDPWSALVMWKPKGPLRNLEASYDLQQLALTCTENLY